MLTHKPSDPILPSTPNAPAAFGAKTRPGHLIGLHCVLSGSSELTCFLETVLDWL